MRIKNIPNQRYLGYAIKTKMWQPVVKSGWIVKFSTYRDCNVLLTIVSQHTGQTIIRFFKDEDQACNFINFVLELDAYDYQETL